ncbi:MAG: phosphotransferase [Anaerolineae bacterium]|nr:phosphotransferase [Anaerolineae bacterium]
MDDNRLAHIQRLQFTDRSTAESLTASFIAEVFPHLEVAGVRLRPSAVSLNSFNGLLTLRDGRELFFKTHVEPGGIVGEYYNAALLAEAGYPVIRPLFASTEYGKQFLIYDLIVSPSVFEVAREIEAGTRSDQQELADAQNEADRLLWQIYAKTLARQSAQDASKVPVQQLFYHRLGTRYQQFYEGKEFQLPDAVIGWEELLVLRWRINGVEFDSTLGAAIDRARELLTPAQEGWSVVGHGDAHNGNVFFTSEGLIYFDPAFGGRHHPLLDLAKPLFHNVSATWMYHPQEVAARLQIKWRREGDQMVVEHNYVPSALRRMFFESKLNHVLKPLIQQIDLGDWQRYLKSALLCCPLLTMNLADRDRFPAEIGLLGLCYVVEMGMDSDPNNPTQLDRWLAEAQESRQ